VNGLLADTVVAYCRNCGRIEIPRGSYSEMKGCVCGGIRILASRHEWAVVDALRDELRWRRDDRHELDDFHVIEQYPIPAVRFDIEKKEYRRFSWYFDAGITIWLPSLVLRCLLEVDGKNHYSRRIARDQGKEADAAELRIANGGLYVVHNDEVRPRYFKGEGFSWEGAYRVAAELAREMLGRHLAGDTSRRRW
jgi:hypothetical protein